MRIRLATIVQFFGLAALLLGIGASVAEAAQKELPSFETLWQAVDTELAKFPGYQQGDLISRKQVAPIFPLLQRLGWKVYDQEEIVKLVPDDNEYFVKQMRTKAGLKFMRQMAKYPLGFDRIDRIGRMSMGNDNVDALIRGPDGYKMIQYMTETVWGKNMGNMLSNAPKGKDFNSATGRLYTADALMLRLQESYEKELERRGLKPKQKPQQ
jgi:hypothetical protein